MSDHAIQAQLATLGPLTTVRPFVQIGLGWATERSPMTSAPG